jgi:signal transduction histidine kinase
MDADIARQPAFARLHVSARSWLGLLAVAIGYYAAAQAAFAIGTLSDRIFAPFWPPNAVLFCALVLTPRSRWWALIAAVFPMHVLAELQVGMPAGQMAVAFVTNCAVALANAGALLWLSDPPWFGSIRKAAVYILVTAGICPALVAFGGAFVPILGGGEGGYFVYWSNWYVGNALASLTLGPIILTWAHNGRSMLRDPWGPRHLEAIFFILALLATGTIALELSVGALEGSFANAFVPAALYLPLPVILWGAVRFGERGASGAILVLAVVSISLTLQGHSPFVTKRPETSVLALQLFLIGVAVPVLVLAAAVDELRNAERATRKLIGALLKAEDEERRRIARELHDSTAQNLVAASLLATRVTDQLGEPLQEAWGEVEELLRRSTNELRLVSYVLHPPQLDESGLASALAKYATGFSERSGIEVDVRVPGDFGRLPRDTELALYRVAQEALTNVERHSGSRSASVRLARRRMGVRQAISLSIQDSGVGMPPVGRSPGAASGNDGSGVGLDSMKERLSQIGGRLWINSASGRTVVNALVPADG